MKQHNSERPIQSRVSPIVVEGRRMIRTSARKAGAVAGNVARRGRRIVGSTVHRTEVLTKRHPWAGLGAAACTGLCLGALAGWLYFRD